MADLACGETRFFVGADSDLMTTSHQSASAKRFYKSADVSPHEGGGFGVLLDGRSLKTPAGRPLVVPTEALAHAIAREWNAQAETIVPASLPLTKLANTAIDGVAERRAEVVNDILTYAGTDLLFYRAAYPTELVRNQAAAWDPILRWVAGTYDAPFSIGIGIAHIEQPATSLAALRSAIETLSSFKLAALHVMTALTGSAIISLACASGFVDLEAAWAAAHVDENWQVSQWGEDFDGAQRQRRRFAEFESASRFYTLSSASSERCSKR